MEGTTYTVEKHTDKEVPGPLAILQAVINTRYGRVREDDWKNPELLRAWLVAHQLLASDTPLSQGDYRRMIDVREALRGLLYSNAIDGAASIESIETLNHAARHAPITVHFRQDGEAQLRPDIEGVDGVIGSLLAIVYTAMADTSWSRLKVCRNARCQKAFYDTSRNRSGAWCSMATCGSRVKARTYRRRQQESSEHPRSDV